MKLETDGTEVEGVAVYAWVTQSELAEWFRYTTRHVQNLELRGLPNVGSGPSKRYPVPHSVIWMTRYRVHQVLGDVVEHLPFRVAHAEHVADLAEADGDLRIHRRGPH